MKIVTIERGREVHSEMAERVRIEASYALRAGSILAEAERELHRPIEAPDRLSVQRAMVSVEHQLVQALWTLARLPDPSPFGNGRCGLDYIHDRMDKWEQAMANGGKWVNERPRAPLPSSRSIDAMHAPLEWLTWLPREQGKIVSVAAGTKRGDRARNVAWPKVREILPATRTQTIRTLQRRYQDGLRTIVAILTERAMSKAN